MGVALASLNPPFPRTVESVQMKKTQKSSIFIYGSTPKESGLWTDFLASPDLERSLTKTKKELRQTPILYFIHGLNLTPHWTEAATLTVSIADGEVNDLPS